jgi:hypothetical protein
MKEKYSHDALNKKLEELSLPDEEQSWQKMKALLDKDEKKDRILPPFFLNCAGWALLILFTAGIIFIFHPFSEDNSVSKEDNSVSKIDPIEKKKMPAGEASKTPQAKSSSENGRNSTVFSVPLKTKDHQNPGDKKYESLITKVNNSEEKKRTGVNSPVLSRLKKYEERTLQPAINSPINEALTQSIQDKASENNIVIEKDSRQINDSASENDIVIRKDPSQISVSTSENNMVVKKDFGQINDSTTLEKTDKDSIVSEKKTGHEKNKTSNFYLAAGLSLHQQLPINGQSLNDYSVNGRKSSFADYLPAIYLRLYKENKWFLQAGFRYSAPQATKELLYRSTTTRDNIRRTTTIATLRLKKTFYHQLPFSFNYSLFPNFSLGGGGIYSRFESAISEIELKVRNNQTNTETVTRSIINIPPTTDSVYTTSQWHYLLQAEYSWKKWGAGFRYTGGLRPFIRYIENGIMKKEKNNSLQIFLRYDFLKRPLSSL